MIAFFLVPITPDRITKVIMQSKKLIFIRFSSIVGIIGNYNSLSAPQAIFLCFAALNI